MVTILGPEITAILTRDDSVTETAPCEEQEKVDNTAVPNVSFHFCNYMQLPSHVILTSYSISV